MGLNEKWLYLLPFAAFIAMILWARQLGGWEALIVGIWAFIVSAALLGAVVAWQYTHKWYYTLAGVIIGAVVCIALLRIIAMY